MSRCMNKLNLNVYKFHRWPSQIFDENGNQCQDQKIVGYRIYVNGQPKGMVKAHKNRAMVEGLRLQHEYKITVVALGTLGESPHSNAGNKVVLFEQQF